MFFADSTGLFSLVCLWIQCLMAWMSMGFFAVLGERDGVWVRQWRRAFLALAIALTALSLRFALAHHFAAGRDTLEDRELPARVFYGTYLGGKVAFAWFLLTGAAAMRRRGGPALAWTGTVAIGLGVGLGAVLPTIEMILLVQSPWFAFACLRTSSLLHGERNSTDPDPGRRLVRAVTRFWAAAWLLYGVAVLVVGPLHPRPDCAFSYVLRFNSMVDLAVQMALACGLIMLVMHDARRTAISALDERDHLREQLRRDEKARALSTLIGGIAHEINNPLTAMLGFADDLVTGDPARRDRAARVVREQAERCRAIVRRMSMLGRHSVTEACEIVAAEPLQRALGGQAAAAEAAGVTVELVGGETPVFADPSAFELVVGNLVANAIHASPRGGRVRVVVEATATGAVLVVEDQGPGLPVADRERAFEPFWTTRPGVGAGLGLAVVASLVAAHGGEVTVGDAAGGGARLAVTWPRRRVPTVGDAQADGLRLLIVDDEPLVRMTIARQALRDGWQVDEVGTVDEALHALFDGGARFDAMLCDLRMPGRSGVQLHDLLHQRAPELLQRSIFITGDLASEDAVSFAERCSAPIVGKPFLPSELCARLRVLARGA